MTIRECFDRIYETYSLEDMHEQSLEQFKDLCQDSPLSNAAEDDYIEQYESLLCSLATIHYHVRTSYLNYILEAREQ